MLKQLVIAHNSLDINTWESIETENIIEALQQRFTVFPENARLYHKNVSQSNDVTPRSEADIEALHEMEGPFYAVNYAGDPLTLLVVGAIALIALVVVVALKPKIPNVTNRNVQSQSPNNALSGRTNAIRINGRIPDIFGTVRSTPDLIAVPYSVFENNIECEYTYMCIGRGSYEIDPTTIRDGTTPVNNIDGETVEVFGPNTSPNTGDDPLIRIGEPITRRVISAVRSKSVNGQTLLADNEAVDGALNPTSMLFNFRFPNTIYFDVGDPGGVALNTLLTVGGQVTVMTSSVPNYKRPYNLSAYVDDIPSGIFGSVLDLVPGGVHPPGAIVLGDGHNADVTLTERVRFHADGTVEYQTVNDIGSPNRPFNHQGYAYIQLTMPTVSVAGHPLNFSGKYVASAVNSNTISLNSPVMTTQDWVTMTGMPGAVTPWVDVKFFLPLYPLVNVSGVYDIASLTSNVIQLTDEAYRINNDWIWLRHMPAYPGSPIDEWIIDRHAFIYDGAVGFGNWAGPFILDVTTTTEIIANYVALNGLYKDDGTTQTAADVDIQLGATPCAANGTPTGSEQFFSATLHGSSLERGTIGYTLYCDVSEPGRYKVRSRRVTPKDLDFTGQISDEVKWRDVYASSPVPNMAFGDITTLHCVTHATQQALAVSERQINMIVTRKLPQRLYDDVFSTTLYPTNNAADIISFICLDPKLGNRSKAEVNFSNIYSTVINLKNYFRNSLAQEFNYTIDSDNLSFEETLQMVATAIFCNAHRRGNVIELVFEGETDISTLLFNHRNKVPGSETRTVTFGNVDDNDGIEYEYVSPVDDAIVTLYIPEDRSAIKPRKVQSVGIRTYEQAYWHAHREFNKLQYQHTGIEFDATQEADLLGIGDRILVADNTRPDTQDGEIEAQEGLIVTLSQPVVLKDGINYLASLQLDTGQVQNIPITGIEGDPYSAVLASAPAETLITDDESVAKTHYVITRAEDGPRLAALVTSKEPSGFTSKVQAINYDARYYGNDFDIFEAINVQWEDQQLPFSTVWNFAAWSQELSLFCIIGNSAQCATSPDGVTWTARNLPSYQSWNVVVWSPELSLFLVITHTGNASATSPDGINWTARTLPVYTQWGRFAWNGSQFVLLEQYNYGSPNRILTSSDAINWTVHNAALPAAASWDGICWAPELGLWCCINGLPSSMAATSPDGIIWTVRTLPGNHYWTSVCWNGSMFVVSCYDEGGTNLYATSYDGITFTPRTLPLTGRWDNVIWAPEREQFCMIGYGGNALLSSDGLNWMLSPMDSISNWASICWGNGPRTFIATSVSNTATANRLDFIN